MFSSDHLCTPSSADEETRAQKRQVTSLGAHTWDWNPGSQIPEAWSVMATLPCFQCSCPDQTPLRLILENATCGHLLNHTPLVPAVCRHYAKPWRILSSELSPLSIAGANMSWERQIEAVLDSRSPWRVREAMGREGGREMGYNFSLLAK